MIKERNMWCGAYYIMIFEFSRAFCAESIHRQKISYAMMLQHHSRLLKIEKNSAKTKFNYFFNFDDPFDLWLYFIVIVYIQRNTMSFVTKVYTFFLILPTVHIVMSDPNSPPTAPKMVPKDNLTFIELFFFSKISSLPY